RQPTLSYAYLRWRHPVSIRSNVNGCDVMRTISETARITQAVIAAAWRRRGADRRILVRDRDCGGLALIVNARGMRWEVQFRPRGRDPETGRPYPNRTVSLGNPTTHSPEMARAEANRLKGQVLTGRDPWQERRAATDAMRSAEAVARARRAEQEFTLEK